MIYYPKSKILINQFTNGNEFTKKSSSKPYIGYYFILSNNTYFTGKTPEVEIKEELIKIKSEVNSSYDNITKISIDSSEFVLPVPYYPSPTEKDYTVGFLSRYFMKRRNTNFTTIIEISPNDYNKYFSNPTEEIDTNIYVTIKINWKITGPLYDDFRDKNFPKAGIIPTNQRLVKLKEKIFPGFSFYITDYQQFAKI